MCLQKPACRHLGIREECGSSEISYLLVGFETTSEPDLAVGDVVYSRDGSKGFSHSEFAFAIPGIKGQSTPRTFAFIILALEGYLCTDPGGRTLKGALKT